MEKDDKTKKTDNTTPQQAGDKDAKQPGATQQGTTGQPTKLDFSTDQIAKATKGEMKQKERSVVAAIVFVMLLIAGMAVAGFLFIKQGPDVVQGQCESEEIRISGTMPGRVDVIYVDEGQMVKRGDTLVKIHSSLVDARMDQAKAAEQVAAAQNRLVDAGARTQTIESAYDVYQQARAATEITRKTYERLDNLAKEGVVSEQKRDEAKAAYEASVAGEAAAKSQWELAKSGARAEEKQAAAALVNVAKGSVKEVQAVQKDQYLVAPCDGQITIIYPHVSELVVTGAPIMTIQPDDRFASFNLRETMLKDIKVGTTIKCHIPALDKTVDMDVYYIRDMGSYANWQATKESGSFDARTFTVRARPRHRIPDFLPGMSVILLRDENGVPRKPDGATKDDSNR